jgi:hypothetical protein
MEAHATKQEHSSFRKHSKLAILQYVFSSPLERIQNNVTKMHSLVYAKLGILFSSSFFLAKGFMPADSLWLWNELEHFGWTE